MLTLQTSLFAMAVGYCVLCLLRVKKLGHQAQYRALTLCIGVATLGYVAEWLMLHPATPYKALWLWWVMVAALALIPAVAFCTERLQAAAGCGACGVRLFPLWMQILLVLAVIAILPLILSAHSGVQFANVRAPVSVHTAFVIHCGMYLSGAVFACLAPCVIWRMHLNNSAQALSVANHSVLRLLMVVLGVKWLSCWLRILHCAILGANPGWELNFILTADIVLTLWALSQVFKYSQAMLPKNENSVAKSNNSPGPKYQTSALNDEAKTRIAAKLQRAVSEQKIHRQADLSLTILASVINERPQYVSQVLNQHQGRHFYGWLSQQRVEDAKQCLLQSPEDSVLTIAERVGFNSKSTFNAAFRKHVGMTPSEFRRALTAAI